MSNKNNNEQDGRTQSEQTNINNDDSQLTFLLQQVEHAKLEWEAAVDSLDQLICLLDENGFILRANRTVERWDLEKVTKVNGLSVHHLLHGDCPHPTCYWEPFWERAWQNILNNQTTDFEFKDRVLTRHIRVQLQPIIRLEDTIAKKLISKNMRTGSSFASLVIDDITEQKQVEEAMLRTQKLESLGIMAGGVAHDFNNLLTGILTECSLALMKLPENVPARSNIEKAINAGERAADVTKQLLAYSGKENYRSVSLNLNTLILDNMAFLSASLPPNIELESQLDPDIKPVPADSGQFQQVIMNLILNAGEAYDGERGTVLIQTQTVFLDGSYTTRYEQTLPKGEYVCLKVTDFGKGIKENILPQIFDPFFTTKFTGRGLGLAAVLGVIRAHRGDIQVSSNKTDGTVFTIYLPVV